MTTRRSIIVSLILAGVFAAGAAWAITQLGGDVLTPQQTAAPTPPKPQWTATAPGRVEPKGGEVRIAAASPGRISELAVKVNDRVVAGDLLVRVDDEDARARLAAADAEVAVRRRDRDAEAASGRQAQDRRQAEDAVGSAERAVVTQRTELERLLRLRRSDRAAVTEDALAAQRSAVTTALDKAESERAALKRAQAAANVPLPTRLEAAVTAARADVTLAEAAWERTRLRAPSDGTVLQVSAKVGELAAASPEQALVVIGDLSALRVRAELEERDLAKVRVGQIVVVRTDAFPGREFAGRVASLAQVVAPARMAARPRRPTDHDTLEVVIDLDPGTALIPGLRVDVYFKADASASSGTAPTPR